MPYLSALEVCSRRGATEIHIYLTLHTYADIYIHGRITCWMFCCEGGNDYGYYAMQQAYVGAVPFLGTVYFDASVVSYLRQQMYAIMSACFLW